MIIVLKIGWVHLIEYTVNDYIIQHQINMARLTLALKMIQFDT